MGAGGGTLGAGGGTLGAGGGTLGAGGRTLGAGGGTLGAGGGPPRVDIEPFCGGGGPLGDVSVLPCDDRGSPVLGGDAGGASGTWEFRPPVSLCTGTEGGALSPNNSRSS